MQPGATTPRPTLRWTIAVAAALARHPTLWASAVKQVIALARPGWWRRRPFVPLPAGPYLAFRSQTMYGDSSSLPRPHDVVVYVRWCRSVTGRG